jgi:hypothetical protein
MKLSLDSRRLRSAVALANAAASGGYDPREIECHLVPIGNQVYFYVQSNFIVCMALDNELPPPNPADVLSFSLQQFSRILSPFTDGRIVISSSDSMVKINAPKLSATLSTIHSDQEIDYSFSFDSVAIVDTKVLKDAIKSIGPISTAGVTSILGQSIAGTVQFFIDGSVVTIQATDGTKYGAIQFGSYKTATEQFSFTVVGPTISKLLGAMEISLPVGRTIISRRGKNLISFGNQDCFFTIPKVHTSFDINPDKARQLLTANHQIFYCQKEELIDAIESAASLYKNIKDAKQDVKIEMDVSKYSITIATCICPRLNIGTVIGTDRIIRELDFEIGSDKWPDDITTLHFNANLLRSVVSAASSERIGIWWWSPNHAIVIYPDTEDTEDIFAAMPLGVLQEHKPPLKEIATITPSDKKYYDAETGEELPF